MRTFTTKIFDELIDGNSSTLYMDSKFNDILGAVEELKIYGYALYMDGSSSTFTMQIEESPDQVNWRNKQATPEVNAVTISNTAAVYFTATDDGSTPSSGYVRLRFQVGGMLTKAFVKAWITGRSEEAGPGL